MNNLGELSYGLNCYWRYELVRDKIDKLAGDKLI